MADRYDILTARESNGKTYFTKLGAMFPNKAGDGFNIMLEGVPASVDGQYRLIAKVPKPRDMESAARQSFPQSQAVDDLDDQIPF